MTKDEMTTLLRSVGVNENTVTAMENAYEMGAEYTRETIIAANAPALAKANAYIEMLESRLNGAI